MGKQPFDGRFLAGLARLPIERIEPVLNVARRFRRGV